MNSFLLTLTAVLILVLSALFAAPLFIDWNDYRSVFETQATNLLGRQVKVGGKVHLVLLPSPELRFEDIKVADQEGRLDRPFLEARSLDASLNISALLTGAIEAHKIAILDPTLRLDVKADGTGNWNDVGRRGVALPFAPKDVMLDEVSVSGGRIEVTREGKPQFTVQNVTGQASAQSLSGPYKVQASYSFNGRPQELRFSTSAPDAAGLFRVKSALRDLDRNTSYLLDGDVTGLGAVPTFDGAIVVRTADVPAAEEQEETNPAKPESGAQSTQVPRDNDSRFELKGPIKATPDRAELPEFDLTFHAKGHPQIFKGKLVLSFGERIEGTAELAASFIDLDALFAANGAEERPSPAAVLYLFADEVLTQAAEIGNGTLAVAIEQAGLGGDLVGAVDIGLASKDGTVIIDHLKATLPGQNHIEASGSLKRGTFGPVFAGPVKIEGSRLQPLTRWAAGDRDVSGQASSGDFSFAADAVVGDGELKLANASGELSETKFRGDLHLQGGERSVIALNLDSDRLDLREVIGKGPLWQSWLPAPRADDAAATGSDDAATTGSNSAPAPGSDKGATARTEATGQDLLKRLRGDDMQVSLRVGELLLPDLPAGKLDARFSLHSGTLDVAQLDFAAANALALSGKGRIERLDEAPSGQVDFALRASDGNSLKVATQLLGLPESVSRSHQLPALAPLDLNVSLVASRQDDLTNAVIKLGGKTGTSDIALTASAVGDPAKLGDAKIEVDGKVTGEKPQALLVLLFPDLPLERIATPAGSQGRLIVNLTGVPKTKVTGKAALETEPIEVAFLGQGSLQPDGLALSGKGAVVSRDASAALTLLGLDAPPSAAGIPMSLRLDLTKRGAVVDLHAITGSIAGEKVAGSVHLDQSGAKTRFSLDGNASGSASLPSLLGVLVAWQRTPSTEETLGTVVANASDIWPLRGFSLGLLETMEGGITLKADTLSLGSAINVQDAALAATVGKEGLAVTALKGRLFGGDLAASGTIAPRGNGAELTAQAEVKGGKLAELGKNLTGSALAMGPFDLAFNIQGEGLSPQGLVAGLTGGGTLALGPGTLQSFSAAPLRSVVAMAANKTIKADKDEIAAEAKDIREKVTKGTSKFAPAKFTFDIKNGTLSLAPATLSSAGAETKINGYVELPSLKLDSEWAVALTGAGVKDVPPVNVVFAGALNKAAEITPAIDTSAVEAYLTMRRMQEGVERLETLDVSGKTQPAEAEPEGIATIQPEELPLDSATPSEPEPPPPAAEPETSKQPAAPAAVPTASLPSALELLQGSEESNVEPGTPAAAGASEALPKATEATSPKLPEPSPARTKASKQPAPVAAPAPQPAEPPKAATVNQEQQPELTSPNPVPTTNPEEQPPVSSKAATTAPDELPNPAATDTTKPPHARSAGKPRKLKPEAPDDWRKGISIFGGG